ncbi:putative glycosyl hydrolase family 88 [Lyophyllum shimeji]|uniref:Glycosyl hydrolase family 88 n=1 Tax=Lyophyllum shimeji TaxID=47721 RepID=A0A9P3PQU9_LYOSH|nr:putative glycosyl hydrolase family 88 [Lyophyllum shimeji]
MFSSLALTLLSLASAVLARPQSYAVWAADSGIARGQGNGLDSSGKPIVSYEHGEFQWALRQLYERTGNRTYFDYIVKGVDNIVFDNGTVHGSYTLTDFVLDPLRTGPTFLYLYAQTQKSKYKIAADTFRSQLNAHPRTAQGQFWHKLKYPNQGWLDGIYMGEIFYAQYTSQFQPSNTTAWADITSQFQLMFENTVQNATAPNNTGLLYHGYDFSHKAVWASADRGHSPEVWDRALGWYSMALVDVLEIIPSTNHGHTVILNILKTLAPRIRDAADPETGAWWLVITQPGRAKNYFESSGTAMFVYALLKAVRLGLVEDKDGSIVTAAKKAYQYILQNFVVANADGTMSWLNTVIVGSLDTTGDFNYYVSQPTDVNDLKGLAAFVLASLEYEEP